MQHFDLAVIGSGAGNSLIDARFDHWNIALIDRSAEFGGTCLNRGCIPTKMFAAAADLAGSPRDAQRLGVNLRFEGASWPEIRGRVFGRIDPIAEGGLDWRERSANVTVFRDEARFVGPKTLRVGAQEISAEQVVIAAGSRPRMLDVPGIRAHAARVFTSDNIMRIEELPERLVIVGGGFIAAEFAHIFSALGAEVTIINRSEELLRNFDRAVAEQFTRELGKHVKIRLNQQLAALEAADDGGLTVVTKDRNGIEYDYPADALLLAVGRVRNSDTLDLGAAGVAVRGDGQVIVDPQQRTNVPGVWALGDVSSDYLLRHVANAEARTVAHNLLHPDALVETDHRYVPAAVFSKPQVATVGATEEQLRSWGTRYVASTHHYADVAAGWALEDEGHFVKLLADPETWHLLGAHIVGPQAPTLIQPLIQAMSFGQSVTSLARGQYWIHPSMPEVVENALLGLLAGRSSS